MFQRAIPSHGAEAPWSPGGHGGSQICTAPKPRGRKVVTAGNQFARCQGPMVTRRSQWDTNLHSAEAPWPYSGHIGKQICTAPRPRGRHTVTMDHKFARRLGPVVTGRPQRVTNSHGAKAPWPPTRRTRHCSDEYTPCFTRKCGNTKADPTRIRRGSDADPRGEFGPESPFFTGRSGLGKGAL